MYKTGSKEKSILKVFLGVQGHLFPPHGLAVGLWLPNTFSVCKESLQWWDCLVWSALLQLDMDVKRIHDAI